MLHHRTHPRLARRFQVSAFIGLFIGSALFASNLSATEQTATSESVEVIKSHAFAVRGEPKYPADFPHFDYVNPDAPKGGSMRLATTGGFDSFNRYARRGESVIGAGELYDTLMTTSSDEISVYYGLIAEFIEYPVDYSWVSFHINPAARFHDGTPITAHDVVFSFNKFFEQGVPQYRSYYADVTEVTALSDHQVMFRFAEPNKDYVSGLAGTTVLPRHFWAERDLGDPLTAPPLSSGPYKVGQYAMGQFVTYERVPDYWAANLPVNKGRHNFNTLRYDYYRDSTVALEAFKAGEYDFRQENVAKQWAEDYVGPALTRGDIKMEELPHEIPQPMQAFLFNTQNPLFEDRRVRQAINLAMDFEWLNRNIFYGAYARNYSYFQNTEYSASGLPTEQELAILEPFRDQLPPEVFGEAYRPNVTDGSGTLRNETRQALALLRDAGWELRNQRLVNVETGRPFEFELLLHTPTFERVALPLQRNLERMGIRMTIRVVDTAQYLNRTREFDFDMAMGGYSANAYPSSGMRIAWRSDFIDSSWNRAGVQDPVIDALIDGIVANQENDEMLMAYGRAFDRVAMWNFYVIPNWHNDSFWIATWDKFDRPAIRPKYDIGTETWWQDNEKAARLRR
ncbi:extracellular solute-binding protein [Salinispirillum sp. LH 10-3-1]|uniref:Extracellular solute-binding protein n=1 Tax=Salinispirillum sp. LH 10-3-1 TaxID=2952525 RepID=A0AB38YFJ6_9GAMM